MIIKRTNDHELIRRIWIHPEIYTLTIDDGCPKDPQNLIMPDLTNSYCLIGVENPDIIGLFVFIPFNHCTVIGHMMVLPEHRGDISRRAGLSAINWIKENTKYTKIIGFTPDCNVAALRYIEKLGFKQEGCLSKSYLRDGKYHNQIISALSL